MSRSQFYSIKLFILRHAWLNLWDKHMTTGRINQVTLLSVRDLPQRIVLSHDPLIGFPTHTLAAEAGRVNVDESQIVRCSLRLTWLFGSFNLTLRDQPKANSLSSHRELVNELPFDTRFVQVDSTTARLKPKRATVAEPRLAVCFSLNVYPSGKHTNCNFPRVQMN